MVRKAVQAKPVSGLRSLGTSLEQQGDLPGSGFETKIDNASAQRSNLHTSADSMPVDTLQTCDKAASR